MIVMANIAKLRPEYNDIVSTISGRKCKSVRELCLYLYRCNVDIATKKALLLSMSSGIDQAKESSTHQCPLYIDVVAVAYERLLFSTLKATIDRVYEVLNNSSANVVCNRSISAIVGRLSTNIFHHVYKAWWLPMWYKRNGEDVVMSNGVSAWLRHDLSIWKIKKPKILWFYAWYLIDPKAGFDTPVQWNHEPLVDLETLYNLFYHLLPDGTEKDKQMWFITQLLPANYDILIKEADRLFELYKDDPLRRVELLILYGQAYSLCKKPYPKEQYEEIEAMFLNAVNHRK